MKNYLFLILSLFFVFQQNVFGQSLSKKQVEKLEHYLIQEAVLDFWKSDTTMIIDGDVVRDKDSMFLSHFYAETKSNWQSDFDKDGNMDIVFQTTDEGLGGGGNAFGYDFQVLLLDKNGNIKSRQSFFGGGKLSMATLSILKVKDGRIFTKYEENPYGKIDADLNNLKTYYPIFSFKEGILIEENYNKCPLKEMDKRIFKQCDSCDIKRIQGLDDQFNIEQTENFKLADGTHFFATLSGCEDIDLYFTRTIPFVSSLKKDKKLMKQILLEHLDSLIAYTRFASVLKECKQKFETLQAQQTSVDEYGGSRTILKLSNKWEAILFTSGNEEQGSFITIRLNKYANNREIDFWQMMDKKMNRK